MNSKLRKIGIAAVCMAALAGCKDEGYVANVTELRLVSMEPQKGYPGDIVTILGRNFSPDRNKNIVLIDGVQAEILEAEKDKLQIILPELSSGEYIVSITAPSGESDALRFTYLKVPDHQYLVSTIVGVLGAYAVKDGVGTAAITKLPTGLVKAPDGSIWFTDRGFNLIRRISPDLTVTTLADVTESSGSALWQGCFGSDGIYYFIDKAKGMLRKYNPADNTVATIASGMKSPMNCCFGKDGCLYVSARDDKAIYKFDKDMKQTTFATLQFGPNYCKFAPDGNLIVTLNSGYKFISIAPDGTISDFLANGVKTPEMSDGEPGKPLTATIKNCFGFDFDSKGVMYISDNTFSCIRRLTPGPNGDYSKGTLETIIGSTAGYADGTGLKVKMKQPYEILVYDDNTLYFTDTVNYLIRKVTIK